jgi:hypothetical protein
MLESRRRCWSGRNVGSAERVARACARWRMRVDGVGKYWAAGAERAHGHEQAMLECDVPSNGTRRRSAVESCCARCRNATAVPRTQLKCSMRCRYAWCWRTEGPAVGRGVKGARRYRADIATVCRCGATRPRRRRSSR